MTVESVLKAFAEAKKMAKPKTSERRPEPPHEPRTFRESEERQARRNEGRTAGAASRKRPPTLIV